jgi:SOS-response transcriptional repressor LexA
VKLGITPQMRRCAQVIAVLTVDGVPPSYEEIRQTMELSTVSRVGKLVDALVARGWATRKPRAARSVEIVRPLGVEAPEQADLLNMTDAQLRFHLALVCGILAQRMGAYDLIALTQRIGARLVGRRAA